MVTDIASDDRGGLALTEAQTNKAQETEAQVLAFDRRRAGRQFVSPVLVPLLRDPASVSAELEQPTAVVDTQYRDFLDSDPFQNEMAPSRGILLGLSISMLFWGAIGYTVFR